MSEFECNGCADFCILDTGKGTNAPEYCPKSGNPCDDWEAI